MASLKLTSDPDIDLQIPEIYVDKLEGRPDEGTVRCRSLHSAKGGAVETGCSDLRGVIY